MNVHAPRWASAPDPNGCRRVLPLPSHVRLSQPSIQSLGAHISADSLEPKTILPLNAEHPTLDQRILSQRTYLAIAFNIVADNFQARTYPCRVVICLDALPLRSSRALHGTCVAHATFCLPKTPLVMKCAEAYAEFMTQAKSRLDA